MSKRFTLNKRDIKKIATGAVVALVGVALAGTTELVSQKDLGNYTPYAIAGWSVLANAIRRWLMTDDVPETPSEPAE